MSARIFFRRPRSMAIDSGTIARSGDGSTAPSEALDGRPKGQVGEQRHIARISEANPYLRGRCISSSPQVIESKCRCHLLPTASRILKYSVGLILTCKCIRYAR